MSRYPSDEKIYQALQTIKQACVYIHNVGSDCKHCSFSVEGKCPFIEGDRPPLEWKIAPLPGDWYAFLE